MFELNEDDIELDDIMLSIQEANIPQHDQKELYDFMLSLFKDRMMFEASIMACISLYVAKEKPTWRKFLRADNLNRFVNDSVLIMCQEGEFHSNLFAASPTYNFFEQFVFFLSEQYITIYEC